MPHSTKSTLIFFVKYCLLAFEVVPKTAFGWQFVAYKNLGNTPIEIAAGNGENGKNSGFNESRQGFDNTLGAILNLWVHTSTLGLSLTER